MRKQFVAYIMGDSNFVENLKTLERAGADFVEIGIPFSDPVADGPIIMAAGQLAIQQGMTAQRILETLKTEQHNLQVNYLLMTYMHTIEAYGEANFMRDAEDAGVYGLIIPDMPAEYIADMKSRYPKRKVKLISLIAMTANTERIETIARQAEGFIYTVTMNQITGQNGEFHPELKEKLALIQQNSSVPVFTGFGIRTPEQVKQLAALADGIIIGSEIVRRFETEVRTDTESYLSSIRHALDEIQ
ncbi:tryptophan synthase subunit alpha [Staphylococcus muscae]|uniref:Tryptophan synthase alpha chain n=1 Tax=Staphylococcus muscae TaxID=1294 RepID=A0A240C9S6_9STAP|nr:tryptophan synthase subunit alpha [Staphylococcus muscae]AVQ33809.1 tryptophan synthase subunit alpha [Staphylococcus muscae]PNZ06316.1 tryptophan synthase subunit alpha [Staphylococcus muscae]GGA87889.1 tryptophan synthase alpha chain [Staphylococcus muscae]SNW04332.1 tryptophan synthase subunit alpha [Staphylococcus muscae]